MPYRKLGEILLAKKIITDAQLNQALAEQRLSKDFLGRLLVKHGWITEQTLLRVLSEQSGIPLVSLKEHYIDWSMTCKYTALVASERKFIPIKEEDEYVTIAIYNPLDVALVAKIDAYVKPKKIKLVLASQDEVEDFVGQCERRAKSSLKNLIDGE